MTGSLLPKPVRELSEKQIAFVERLVETGCNRKAAAIHVGIVEENAASMAYQWWQLEEVRALHRDLLEKKLGALAAKALAVQETILEDSKSDWLKFEVSKDVLDRAGYKPDSKAGTPGVMVQVNIDLS